MKKFVSCIAKVFTRASQNAVYAVSGHATLFMIISFFPFIMLLLAAIKYMPFTQSQVLELIDSLPLGSINSFLHTAVKEVYDRSGGFTLSITAITLFWSASTSIFSITLGLNNIYRHKETRNYLWLRGMAIVYTVLFALLIILTLVLMVFGKALVKLLVKFAPFFGKFDGAFNFGRQFAALLLFFFVFDLLYTVLPNRPSHLLFEMPGAVISALGWYVFSLFYSMYMQNIKSLSYLYGSLTAVVLMMIWLYFCMYIFFIGAEVNQLLSERGWCRKRRAKMLENAERRSEKRNASKNRKEQK